MRKKQTHHDFIQYVFRMIHEKQNDSRPIRKVSEFYKKQVAQRATIAHMKAINFIYKSIGTFKMLKGSLLRSQWFNLHVAEI